MPYYSGFMPYGARIHQHAAKLGVRIDEYDIYLNNDQLFKMYTRSFTVGKGKVSDEIFDLSFMDFKDMNNNLVAWMWFGVSHFKGAIEAKCPMRGIRLRKANIQIGDEDTLQQFFAEPRGIHYFIGELFCVSKEFIPNSRRDYFNENPKRVEFEKQLKMRFRPLSKLYHDGSDISSAFRKIDEAEKKRDDFAERVSAGSFASNEERQTAQEELQKAQEDAAKAVQTVDKLRNSGSTLAVNIIRHIEDSRQDDNSRTIVQQATKNEPQTPTPSRPQFTQKEQRLISKIFGILKAELAPAESERLIHIIQDKLK